MSDERRSVGVLAWIALTVAVALALLVLGGIAVALIGGVSNDRELAATGGKMVLLGVMPLVWLLLSDVGQALSEISVLKRGKK